jgi:hypothetical protein
LLERESVISIDGLQSLAELLKSLDIEMQKGVALKAATKALETALKQTTKQGDVAPESGGSHDSVGHCVEGDRGIVGSTSQEDADSECGTNGEPPQQFWAFAGQAEADSIVQITANALRSESDN